jgi:serine/threonine protein phosphatase PrpC
MSAHLQISLGQYSDKGRKETNQDFHGACIPAEPQLSAKGIVIAVADGISTSSVSRIASEATIKALLDDYYCTSAAWSVKRSAQRVLMAVNSWLYAQTRQSQYRYDQDRGYVCTLSSIVLKSSTAHLFHVGDARIYRVRGSDIEQLTEDHRLWVSQSQSYLNRALGAGEQVEIDYRAHALEVGDIFVIATDGVHEHVTTRFISQALSTNSDLDTAARRVVEEAHARGSDDNLTVQIVRIDSLPQQQSSEVHQQLSELALPPPLEPRMLFDGYRILRELHASHRSHVHLAIDTRNEMSVVIKTPSVDLRGDPGYLERFLMEEWIARRVNSAHVAKAPPETHKRNYVYTVSEYIEGQSLTQWMIDHPTPSIEEVRGIIEQIGKGLMAFHRLEMLHQDVRPDNVMIDRSATVKLIDFGSTRVAGIADGASESAQILGTVQYAAPEYFLGDSGTQRSDLYSLGVIAYQMLSGRLPFGTEAAKARTRLEQRRLTYRSVLREDRAIPAWIDDVLRKATNPDPFKRYEEVAEFLHDLRHPTQAFLNRARRPLLERNPVAFWKTLSLILAVIIVILLARN